ncbi:DUF6374 family protein [Nocardia yamanashiensis]|uniref:DUF6374 family protein n=1 Tax=Nocardia yamanashiensis TaxID=209247 RepID=UPI00082CB464|nr:DUF6374 family protein [Nocardia yamanashiensis]
MPELSRRDWATMNLDHARNQLLHAAAFNTPLTPEQLETTAGKISEGLRIFLEETERPENPWHPHWPTTPDPH